MLLGGLQDIHAVRYLTHQRLHEAQIGHGGPGAGLLLLPFVIWEITKNPPALESHLIGWQVFSIFAGTIVGLGIWNHVLRYWPASRALLFNNLIPVFAMFWAWKFIDEKITPTFWPAMALVVAGVVVGLAPWRK